MLEIGTENGHGLHGMWIVHPITETREYVIPILYTFPLIGAITCWSFWEMLHRN